MQVRSPSPEPCECGVEPPLSNPFCGPPFGAATFSGAPPFASAIAAAAADAAASAASSSGPLPQLLYLDRGRLCWSSSWEISSESESDTETEL
eukprot:CAMPEP_0114548160 /NCGR_PEP_ID=MMETSP0114-20121206/4833_1 /TAXON_ID=31324 /ORGANISM="Goniomonas sp, Strain m" /LENGTH=92 /DNA_ID=CAMNT_0001732731 /DNA_START=124 /DNA_END=402 /DNA_ORIENTATION=-